MNAGGDAHNLHNNIEESSEIARDDGAAIGSGDGQDSDYDESITESPQLSSTPTVHQSKREDNKNQTSKGNRGYHTSMYRAAMRGDWHAAEILLQLDPNITRAKITERGDTVLHIAAAMKHTKFVRELLKWISPSDLDLQNDHGQTAFSYAAASGVVEIAAAMREKNKNPINLYDMHMLRPLHVAALLRNKDMVSYLYQSTRAHDEEFEKYEYFHLLLFTIENDMIDMALKIFSQNKDLATMRNNKGITPLLLLARKEISDISSSREAILESLATIFSVVPSCLSWMKRIFEQPLMRKRAGLLAEMLWTEIQRFEQANGFMPINMLPILHNAAEVGNVGLITMLARSDPDLLLKKDTKTRTIFHIAVLHRQEKTFSRIHQIGTLKDLFAISRDNEGNNILHLAGKLAPLSRRKIVSGAALQMQRELLWFKVVEKIVPSLCLEMENFEGQVPRKLFSEEHQSLLKDGEKWMKETANSCMLMATLIATVVFAAAFTVPGGNNNDTGNPILLKRNWFTFFLVSDAVAMFSSTFSIIIFLSILTSRFQEDDFLVSLPTKLMVGLTALFSSIVGTIFAFTSTCFLLFINGEESWLLKWVAALACISLITLFGTLHFKLWVDTIRSTYWSRLMFRPGKNIF